MVAAAKWTSRPRDRMRPGLGGQGSEGRLEFSRAGGELNSEPTTEKRKRAHEGRSRWIGFLGHHVSSKKEG